MMKLAKHLSDYLTREIKAAVESSGGGTSRLFEGETLRLFFAGPPKTQLEQLFDLLTRDEGKLVIATEQEGIDVPVYLVDPGVDDPSEESFAARCTPDYLVKVRNRGYPVFLALQEIGVAMNQSLSTAMKPLGVRPGINRVDRWMQEPLIEALVAKSTEEIIGAGGRDEAHEAIRHALGEAWNADERNRDKRCSWKMLEKLVEIRPSEVEPHLALSAVLGLPACSENELGNKNHLATLDRVAELFQTHGFRKGLDELEENAGEDLLPHVQKLRAHLEGQGIIEASEFARSPLQCYCPVSTADPEVPIWWQHLTVDAWSRLLDAGSDIEPTGKLDVRVLDQLIVVPRGMPCLTCDHVELEISVGDVETPVEITINRASGQSKLREVGRIKVNPGTQEVFNDSDIPDHDRFVRYKLEAKDYTPVSVKAIVLDKYGPGIIALARSANKAKPFKLNKKAKDNHNKAVYRYECDIELSGMGSHSLDLFTSSRAKLAGTLVGYEVDAEQEGVLERPVNKNDEYHSTCLVETDEECYYDFLADPNGSGDQYLYRIYLTADEIEPTGASSEFDRLVIQNRAAAKRDQVNARVEPVNCRAMNLEEWALEDTQSFRPLLLGPDYLDAWRKPKWEERPKLSALQLPVDPRPSLDEFRVPKEFETARSQLLEFLGTANDVQTPSAGMLHLHAYMREEPFKQAIKQLLDAYLDWLETDYDVAAWVDVVSVHGTQPGVDALEPTPYAVLLTPLHPIRLAWQCRAQEMLEHAVQQNKPCPAASMLNPAYFPDCLLLPCRSGSGQISRKPYAAMASSSDYWSVLWSVEAIGRFGGRDNDPVFGTELGISVDGLSSGFSAQQVIRSLDEVTRLLSAKTTLRVGVSSDTSGEGSCNEGIDAWCTANLGPDEDFWVDGGPRSLVIVDHREKSLHPEQAVMASLTRRTDASLQWFKGTGGLSNQAFDLSIIAHLGTMNHEFSTQGIRSAIDPSCLARWRVRKQLPGHETAFIAESRIGQIPTNIDDKSLAGKLLGCIDAIESRCGDDFDSYVFAPNMTVLSNAVDSSSYSAVSSSNIDAACFFGQTEKAYLWDYELPSYARRAGENSGYFLLAHETEGMLVSVRSALRLLGNYGDLEDERISGLLEEISRRGMPTLKRLTKGGSMSLGEVGMLVALRVLQSDFEKSPVEPGLLPVRGNDETLNLIVPADPFKNHFEDLRRALENKQGERPDLLVLSLNFISGNPMHLKITPVEVKARGGVMSESDRRSALSQASLFARFLANAQMQSKKLELWGVAWRSLLATLLDYGFRVYGQLDQFVQYKEWAAQHSATLRSLMNNELDIEVDQRGRLIVIDDSNNSAPGDADNDGFDETIVLSHKDGFSVLAEGGGTLVQAMRRRVDHWQLKPAAAALDTDAHSNTPGRERINTGRPNTTNVGVGEGDVEHESNIASKKEVEIVTIVNSTDEKPSNDGTGVTHEVLDNKSPVDTDDAAGIKFPIGKTILGFNAEEVYFFPGNTELNQLNVGIVGDLGTGKTQLIQTLVYQLRSNPAMNRGHSPNILIFDYKRDYSKQEFVEATGARIIEPFDMPLNLFDTSNSPRKRNTWLERSKFFCDVLAKIYSGIGPVQRERIKDAVKKSYEMASNMDRSAPTIRDVFDAYRRANADSVDTPFSIMSDLVDGEYFVTDERAVQPF